MIIYFLPEILPVEPGCDSIWLYNKDHIKLGLPTSEVCIDGAESVYICIHRWGNITKHFPIWETQYPKVLTHEDCKVLLPTLPSMDVMNADGWLSSGSKEVYRQFRGWVETGAITPGSAIILKT